MMDESASPTCPACDKTGTDRETRVPDHEYGVAFIATYARCAHCASEFQVPMPDGATLAGFYPATYHSMQSGGLLVRLRNEMRWKRLAGLLQGDGVVLDYGCGEGQFLLHAARRTPQRRFFGYEIADKREIRHLEKGRVTIVRGSVNDLLGVLPSCALITMNHVIEHLPDPCMTIGPLTERLATGGVFEGQTPAADSLEQRIFQTRWSGYHAPRHTIVFSPDGLRALLSRLGLAEAEIRGTFNPAGLALSLASLRHGETGGTLTRSGMAWLIGLGLATGLSVIDLLSGAPAVVDFSARRA
ncbi:MAG: class I SAM-dependent methyltransferase [Deltaproteobacteria bacterium]